MAFNTVTLKILLIILIIGLLTSCSSTKSSVQNESNNVELSNSNINFSYSLGKFVETLELEKLCYPVKMYVLFSVDSTGKLYDSDFKPSILSDKNCDPDTAYINTMKMKFENQMPNWKPNMLNDSVQMVRYSIPITFD